MFMRNARCLRTLSAANICVVGVDEAGKATRPDVVQAAADDLKRGADAVRELFFSQAGLVIPVLSHRSAELARHARSVPLVDRRSGGRFVHVRDITSGS